MLKLIVLVIRGYQYLLSPILSALGGHCRFYPSCSSYAIEAFEKKSLPRALLLVTKRICKCHPLHEGGVDFI